MSFHTTPLHLAVISGDIEVVKMVLNKGARIDADNPSGEIPLHKAVLNKKRCLRIVDYLLKNGTDVNIRTNDDSLHSPLEIAVLRRDLHTLRLLLEHGAEVNSRNKYGRTPPSFCLYIRA
jgi:ankyrin repeat protein